MSDSDERPPAPAEETQLLVAQRGLDDPEDKPLARALDMIKKRKDVTIVRVVGPSEAPKQLLIRVPVFEVEALRSTLREDTGDSLIVEEDKPLKMF